MREGRVIAALACIAVASSCIFDLPEARTGACDDPTLCCEGRETVTCYSGPAETEGIGACREGTAICVEGVPGACEGEVVPGLEDCATAEDEDCDGAACTGAVELVRSFGPGEAQSIQALAFSPEGALFAAGTFSGAFAGATSAGGLDAFVARLDPSNGAPIWVHRFGGAMDDGVIHGRALSVLPDGGVIVAATTDGTRDAGDLMRVHGALRLVRLGADGTVIFDETTGGRFYRPVVAARSDGTAYVAAGFEGTIDPGTGALDAGAESAAFVARVDGTGAFVFARALTSTGGATAQAVAVRPDGTATIAGELTEDLSLEPELAPLETGPEEGAILFLVDVAETGTLLRARRSDRVDDASHAEYPQAMIVDARGTTWVTGYFHGPFAIDGTRITTSQSGDDDVFVASFDAGLRLATLQRFGDPAGYQTTWSIDVDRLGQVVVAGNVNGATTFGDAGTLVAYEDADDAADAFAIKLAPDASVTWLASLRGPRFQRALATAIGPDGAVAVGGLYEGDIVEPFTAASPGGTPLAFVALLRP